MKKIILMCMVLVTGSANAGFISTLFASDNDGSSGGAVYFDLTVGSNDLTITGLDINTSATSFFDDFQVWILSGNLTSQGNEASTDWTQVTTGSGTGAGEDNVTAVTLFNSINLTANTLYGFAFVAASNIDHVYTNGNGSNQSYANTDLSLALGSATNTPFATSVFTPRVWNGTIHYDLGNVEVPTPSSILILTLGLAGIWLSRKAK